MSTPARITDASALDALRGGQWNEEEQAYVQEHYRRFTFLLNLLAEQFARVGASAERPATFMDVGPHMELAEAGRVAGFKVVGSTWHHFTSRSPLVRAIARAVPSLRPMMTVVLEREG